MCEIGVLSLLLLPSSASGIIKTKCGTAEPYVTTLALTTPPLYARRKAAAAAYAADRWTTECVVYGVYVMYVWSGKRE